MSESTTPDKCESPEDQRRRLILKLAVSGADILADDADYPFKGYIMSDNPAALHDLHLDADPLPLSDFAIGALRWCLSRNIALRIHATEQRFIDRFLLGVEAIGDAPEGSRCDA